MSALQTIEAYEKGLVDRQNGPERSRLDAWQLLPELPAPGDVMAVDAPPLPIPLPEGKTPSKREYLEYHYGCQRYEAVEPPRRAISQFRECPGMPDTQETYVYTQVHIQGYVFTRYNAACRISFSTERSPDKVNWRQSKRLTPGSLVVLSPRSDNFRRECYVAVVATRNIVGGVEPDPQKGEGDNTPPRIHIYWADPAHAKMDPSLELVMLEARNGYFEALRYSMLGLQHASFKNSKFDKYVIDGCRSNVAADYLQRARVVLPKEASMCDASQFEAFQRMTSRELAIVQGPPGTGKTFTSIVAIQSYVKTLQASHLELPVIIATQTNHALDQLLELCLSRDIDIVRLGGRSSVEDINKRTIFEVCKQSKAGGMSGKGDSTRKSLFQTMERMLTQCFPNGLIAADHFHRQGLLTDEQFESLSNDDWEGVDDFAAEAEEETNSVDPMQKWLDGQIDQDNTYVYAPPQNQRVNLSLGGGEENEATVEEEEDEKEFQLHGKFISTQFILTGVALPGSGWFHQADRVLKKTKDLYKIKPPQRGTIYRCLRQKLVNKVADDLPKLLAQYQKVGKELKMHRCHSYAKVIKYEGIQVLGCTTTGLTKYRSMIEALKPRILMIEEAAETREANITSAFYPSLDQLVLVGDHQQLVPHVDLRELSESPHTLHISLFERFVKMNLPYSMLRIQRRMISAIREVVHAFYPALEDHESVLDPEKRPQVHGMGGQNLWWFQHQWGDQQNGDTFSWSNLSEARMIVGFVQYLVQNNIRPSQITILTYYSGQVDLITEKLRHNSVLSAFNPTREWSVRTVDGFQGEENDIILLSLVRSPSNPHSRARTGFVDDENRAVVATSRARRGMYVFGNSNNILGCPSSAQTWQKVFDVFAKQKSHGYHLPVVCQRHGILTKLTTADDWINMPGGCEQPCEMALACGHPCVAVCGSPCRCEDGCKIPVIDNKKPEPASVAGIKLPLGTTVQPSRRPQVSQHLGVPQRNRTPQHPQIPQAKGRRQSNQKQRGFQDGKKRKASRAVNSGPSTRPGSPVKRISTAPNPEDRKLEAPKLTLQIPREVTSADMMTYGYHACLSNSVVPERATVPFSSADEPLIDTSPSPEKTSVSGSVASKWSEINIREEEESLLLSFDSVAQREAPQAQAVIQETYIQTTVSSNLDRVTSRPTKSTHGSRNVSPEKTIQRNGNVSPGKTTLGKKDASPTRKVSPDKATGKSTDNDADDDLLSFE